MMVSGRWRHHPKRPQPVAALLSGFRQTGIPGSARVARGLAVIYTNVYYSRLLQRVQVAFWATGVIASRRSGQLCFMFNRPHASPPFFPLRAALAGRPFAPVNAESPADCEAALPSTDVVAERADLRTVGQRVLSEFWHGSPPWTFSRRRWRQRASPNNAETATIGRFDSSLSRGKQKKAAKPVTPSDP